MKKQDKTIYMSAVIMFLILLLMHFYNIKNKKDEEMKKIQTSYNYILEKNKKDEFDEVIKNIEEHITTFPNSDKINELLELKKKNEIILEEKRKIEEEKVLFKKIQENHALIMETTYISFKYMKSKIEEYKNKYSDSKNISRVLEIEEEVIKREKEVIKKEEELKKQKEIEREKALKEKKLNEERAKKLVYSKYDEFDNVRWFYAKDNNGNKTSFNEKIMIYGGGSKDSKKPDWLRLKLRYTGSDWIFFDEVIISIDEDIYYINFNYFDGKREAVYGGVREHYDILTDATHISILNKIVNSKSTKIRYRGQYIYDTIISSSEKQKIKNLLIVSGYHY